MVQKEKEIRNLDSRRLTIIDLKWLTEKVNHTVSPMRANEINYG